jgi:hypothetical protein
MMFAHLGEFDDFRPFPRRRKEAAIAPNMPAMLDSTVMCASACKLLETRRSFTLLASLTLLLRR